MKTGTKTGTIFLLKVRGNNLHGTQITSSGSTDTPVQKKKIKFNSPSVKSFKNIGLGDTHFKSHRNTE